jgi:RNA-directed DNA polymerase
MLANLAVRSFDEAVAEIALTHGMIYTRYADDITISTKRTDCDRSMCAKIIGMVFEEMGKVGLSPNISKTRVVPPGGRKIVLGLIVNGTVASLPRDFKLRMRRHLHYLLKPGSGPAVHAQARGFTSILGMKDHLYGLAAYAKQIEPAYGQTLLSKLNGVSWPI